MLINVHNIQILKVLAYDKSCKYKIKLQFGNYQTQKNIIDHGKEKDLHLEIKNIELEEMVDHADKIKDLVTLPISHQ